MKILQGPKSNQAYHTKSAGPAGGILDFIINPYDDV